MNRNITRIQENKNLNGYFFVDQTIKADYCLHVEDDSMINEKIYDGDIAFIKKDGILEDGNIYAVIYGEEKKAYLKKIYCDNDKLILISCSTEYKPIIADPADVFIIGECIGVYRKLRV